MQEYLSYAGVQGVVRLRMLDARSRAMQRRFERSISSHANSASSVQSSQQTTA